MREIDRLPKINIWCKETEKNYLMETKFYWDPDGEKELTQMEFLDLGTFIIYINENKININGRDRPIIKLSKFKNYSVYSFNLSGRKIFFSYSNT